MTLNIIYKVDCLHLFDFLINKCSLNWKQPLAPPRRNIIVANHTANHRVAIETIR